MVRKTPDRPSAETADEGQTRVVDPPDETPQVDDPPPVVADTRQGDAAPKTDPAPTPVVDSGWAADGVTFGTRVWLRMGDGSLVACRAARAKDFSILIGGTACPHVADDAEGVWIYEHRRN